MVERFWGEFFVELCFRCIKGRVGLDVFLDIWLLRVCFLFSFIFGRILGGGVSIYIRWLEWFYFRRRGVLFGLGSKSCIEWEEVFCDRAFWERLVGWVICSFSGKRLFDRIFFFIFLGLRIFFVWVFFWWFWELFLWMVIVLARVSGWFFSWGFVYSFIFLF